LKGSTEIVASSPEQFARDMRAEQGVWAQVIRSKNIKAE
jgi:hypothetical protein